MPLFDIISVKEIGYSQFQLKSTQNYVKKILMVTLSLNNTTYKAFEIEPVQNLTINTLGKLDTPFIKINELIVLDRNTRVVPISDFEEFDDFDDDFEEIIPKSQGKPKQIVKEQYICNLDDKCFILLNCIILKVEILNGMSLIDVEDGTGILKIYTRNVDVEFLHSFAGMIVVEDDFAVDFRRSEVKTTF